MAEGRPGTGETEAGAAEVQIEATKDYHAERSCGPVVAHASFSVRLG